MGTMLGFLLGVVLVVGMVVANGGVLYLLWDWFMVPLGLRTISIPHALGISLIVTFMTQHYTKDERGFWQIVLYWVMKVAFTLFIGWILVSLM